jgi:LuxR family transcriptional regulator, maltose regulon positive regulatory protein
MVSPRHLRMTPPRPPAHLINRPRLVPLLDGRPVVVLAGTAGYGKTTLVTAAARRQQDVGSTLWLTLNDADRNPTRLVSDLLTSAGAAGLPALADPVEQLRAASARTQPVPLLDSLLEVLYDHAGSLLLALDDLHRLSGSTEAVAVVDHLLRWAPDNMRITIATRVVPPMRLQRLRLEDRLTYLVHEELAFTPEETIEVMRAAGLDLDPDVVDTVYDATGGWPAGVRMAILAMRHSPASARRPLELRRDQAVAEYLATEVLASLRGDLRQFVLESCLDERVCPSLIDSMRGTTTAEASLEECVSAGLFLSHSGPDGPVPWYEWHPLFAAHVKRRLASESPQEARQLHARAAAWWREVDAPTGIGHALAAGDADLAFTMFADNWLRLLLEGQIELVLDIIGRLPRESTYRSEVHLAKAVVLTRQGAVRQARVEMGAARSSFLLLPELHRSRFEERKSLVELLLTAYEHGLGAAVESARDLLKRVEASTETPDPVIRATVELFLGIGESRLLHPSHRPLETLRSSAETAHVTGLLALELTALAESCFPTMAQGRLNDAHDVALDVLARADARGWVGLATLAPAVGYLGWLDYWRGNLPEARAELERSLSMLLPFDWELRGLTLNFLAQACVSLGDLRAARESAMQLGALQQAEQLPPWWTSMRCGLEALILSAEGRTEEALALALAPAPTPEYRLAAGQRAQALLRAGRPAEALAELERAPMAEPYAHVLCLTRCLEAEALAALGKDGAHVALEAALEVAEPAELYGPFLAGGERLSELIRRHLRHGTRHPAAVTHVLGLLAEGQSRHATTWGEQLTERERVILRYLATNLTNTEIADAEFISVHTAKTHIAHIYRKLGVTNRRSAIRRAAELELY